MNGPTMDDEYVIRRIRAAEMDLREGTRQDAVAAAGIGRRMRRRRRIVQSAGSVALVAAVLTGAGALNAIGGNGQAVQQVTPPAAAAGPGEPEPGSAVAVATRPDVEETRESQRANTETMLDVLGPDWQEGGPDSQGPVEMRPDAVRSHGMAEGYAVIARVMLWRTESGDGSSLEGQCRPSKDKGSRTAACEPFTLPDGRVVQLQDVRADLAKDDWVWDATMAYFPRPDGLFVRIEFAAHNTEQTTPARQQAALAWLEEQDAIVAELAADPRIRPRVGEAVTPDPHAPDVAEPDLAEPEAESPDGESTDGECPKVQIPRTADGEKPPVTRSYPRNANGQTYGSETHAIEAGGSPDLIEAIGEDGTVGYVKAADVHCQVPASPQDAEEWNARARPDRFVPLYRKDGETVIGQFRISAAQATATQAPPPNE